MKKTDKTKAVVAYYWQHAWTYPKLVIGLLLSLPITILLNNFLPALIAANVLSKLSQHQYHDHDVWASFGPQVVTYAGLILAGLIAWRVVDFFAWKLEGFVQRDIAEEVFAKLQAQTADFHANNFVGSLVSGNSKLLGGYVRSADTSIFQTYPLILSIFFAATILAFRAPLFSISLVLFSVIFLVSTYFVSKPVRRIGAKFAKAESQQTGYLADALSNSMAIKSFAMGDYERQRFEKATRNTQAYLFRFARVHQGQILYMGFSTRMISSISLAIAVVSVMVFNANIGTVFLILSYTANLVDGLFQFGNNGLRNYNRAFGDAADMVDILSQKPALVDIDQPESFKAGRGAINFQQVTFQHDGADDAIFSKFDLKIKPGEKIGLVGHSGSGKTTFTRLLMRFSDIQSGEITIDGQNIANITQDDLHSAIAYVPQEPLLFHRTIRENIAYAGVDADQATIEAVAKMAHAHEFIAGLPKGYETLVGERGVKLSGGQRQRVAIARAMLKNAPILLLDEATSALDSESEALIQDALWKLMEGRTAIVIAHRLSTIQKMDRIIVLDNGKIVEQGSHKDLLQTRGAYAALWARQSGGFIED